VPAGAPNVVFIVLDDVGFAQLGCYGSDLATPNFDRLAANGLRYTNFHTTALCSPTRSCLLTGRNHHANGMGTVTGMTAGFPGYNGRIPRSSGFLSEMVGEQGYATFAVGKWHLTPAEDAHDAGRRGRWPLDRGFERYYGFLGGATHQFLPDLTYDNHSIPPPRTPEQGYHLTEDLADKAIEFIDGLKQTQQDRPFFLYFCTGAGHTPHHAPREWIDAYRGKFDQGWERWREQTFARQQAMGIVPPGTELSARPPWVQDWEQLSADERRLFARFMECFAGFMSHTDHQVGRLLDFLEARGELENTLIFVVSDNGASSEGDALGVARVAGRAGRDDAAILAENLAMIDELGGPKAFNNYPWGWAWAGNTPLRRWKRETHQGGTTDPMIVHWPKGIEARGEIRRQYTHAIDLTPTVLDLLGLEPPPTLNGVTQTPLHGVSFAASFADAGAPERHETQYFEMLGCRALYHAGWKAVTYHAMDGTAYDRSSDPAAPFAEDRWELYHVDEDFSECHDLAATHPERLRALVERWYVEAGKYNVLPLDNRRVMRDLPSRPTDALTRFTYYPRGAPIPEFFAVDVRDRSHTITAEVVIPPGGAEGVLVAQATGERGYSFYVQDGRLHYVYNLAGEARSEIHSNEAIPEGEVTLAFTFTRTGPHEGTGALSINGLPSGAGAAVRMWDVRGGPLFCGFEAGRRGVSGRYKLPFRFSGTLKRLTVDVSGEVRRNAAAEVREALAKQ